MAASSAVKLLVVACSMLASQPYARVDAQGSNPMPAISTMEQIAAMLRPFVNHLETPCADTANIPAA